MAIITETVTINGKQFIHTYSDDGMTIIRDGVEYEEAYDPINTGRTYSETLNHIEETIEDLQAKYEEAKAQANKLINIRGRIERLRDNALLQTTKALYQAILDMFDEVN